MRTIIEVQDEIGSLLSLIRLAKDLHDTDSRLASRTLSGLVYGSADDEFEIYNSMISSICDHYNVVAPGDDDDDWDCCKLYFSDAVIREYGRLCREHSRICAAEYDDDPYVRTANNLYNKWLAVNGCYYCDFSASHDHEKKYGYGFHFIYDCSYFYEYDALIQRIAGLLTDFKDAIPSLQREVAMLKRGTALVPVNDCIPMTKQMIERDEI